MEDIKRMLCLANSYKPPAGRCIAGREITGNGLGAWIRPVSARETREISVSECLYATRHIPELLDVIEFPILRHDPRGHQVENYVIAAGRWKKVGAMQFDDLECYLDKPETLWPNTERSSSGFYDRVDPTDLAGDEGSLMLIKPDVLNVEISFNPFKNTNNIRAGLTYNGDYYNFSITDPKLRDTFRGRSQGEYPIEDALLCVSLTEPYERDQKCYKLVAAVISPTPIA
ncbi:dual OB domain-containing protein [Occallatibacter savannae]|uniref:dual OB domain-containing protein n=1 Tax=Occallatibacter savannae TaxID=1002691 RepID=UPI0013A5826D|nr:hypothetical protein [Occallatibacter savannae]